MSEAISTVNLAPSTGVEKSFAKKSDNSNVQPVSLEKSKTEKAFAKESVTIEQERAVKKEIEKAEEQKAIQEVASKLQEFVNLIDKKLQFSVDDGSGRHIVTVTDRLSGDVIRQIPSEEVLRLAQNLSELAETANRSGKLIVTEV